MRPSGFRQHDVVTYLTRTEAEIVEVARLLDGRGSAQPRGAWLVARAVERLEAHAAEGSRLAAGALVELGLAWQARPLQTLGQTREVDLALSPRPPVPRDPLRPPPGTGGGPMKAWRDLLGTAAEAFTRPGLASSSSC
jgi:hypothetical protein